jgi:nucleotide-binding universal stress UspA family protein
VPTSQSWGKARTDFEQARREASWRRLWMRLRGKKDDLIPYEEVRKQLGLVSQRYRGVQPVPLNQIIGSMGRATDFDRIFLPTQRHSRRKWLGVDSAYLDGVALPPISLYKVGDAYFVVDGHHRVSVARQQEQTFIDAEVIEVESRIPVTADLTIDDLDVLGAYQKFLDETHLDTLRPEQNIRLTMPGDYLKLSDHIRVHKYFVELEQSRELSREEAVTDWYDRVYWPVIETIRTRNLLQDFPGRQEADLYIWIIEHAYYLSEKYGQQLAPSEVARDFVRRFSRRPAHLMERLKEQVYDALIPDSLESGPPVGTWREERIEERGVAEEHLFRDILVTITGAETGWRALTQAAEFARQEYSLVHGLHVIASEDPELVARGREILEEFKFRCEGLGIRQTSSLAIGQIDREITERARWVDMVVINQRRVQGRWAEQPLGTIFQTVASRAARPVLAVPGTNVMPMRKVVLAYDGSPKAREALFVLRHLVTCWKIDGLILGVEGPGIDQEMLEQAWLYLQQAMHPVTTTVSTRYEQGAPAASILRVMEEEKGSLLLMGSYGYQPLLKALLGSTIDPVLREAWFPVLICR